MRPRQDLQGKRLALRLKSMSDGLDAVMAHAEAHHLDLLSPLGRLADIELAQRFHHAIALRWRPSKLADTRTIDQCDFSHHTSRHEQKTRLLTLLTLDFVRAHMDVILIGNPGAGKTFLATCLAYAACNANIKVLFPTAIDMINHLIAAEADHSLLKQLQYSQPPDLLVCDELGYLSRGQQGSHLFFQGMSARPQHTSTVITTNLPFADWGNVFDSTPVATAIADRLVYNSEVRILGGESSRRKMTEDEGERPPTTGDLTGHPSWPPIGAPVAAHHAARAPPPGPLRRGRAALSFPGPTGLSFPFPDHQQAAPHASHMRALC